MDECRVNSNASQIHSQTHWNALAVSPNRQPGPRARKLDFAQSGLPLPLAELTSSEVCRSRFFEIISIFKSSTRSMCSKQLQILCKHTRQPFGIERRCLRNVSNNQRREIQNFPKMHQNLSEIPVWGVFSQNRILKMFPTM